jgi:hypothetical protein
MPPSDTVELDAGTRAAPTNQQPAAPATPAVTLEDGPGRGADADAEALQAAQRALEQANQRATAQEAAARAAHSENARLRDQQARQARASITDRKAVLAQATEAADTDLSRAKMALKAAYDAGDPEAMGAAQEAIASATYRKSQAAGELATIDARLQAEPTSGAAAPAGQPQPAAGGYAPDQRARQWMDQHPRFDADPGYKATALALHNEAGQTHGFGSDAYYNHLNTGLARVYGESHGELPGGQQMQRQDGGNTSSAAPTNRGGGGSQSGSFKAVQTGLGVVNVARNQAGGMRISFADPSVRENMEEGAKICFPGQWAKDPQKALAEYVGEQVRIAEERNGGGTAGMVNGDGAIYR